MVAVVGGFDLDDAIPAGEAAGEPHGVQGGLGATVGESPLGLPETATELLGDHRVVGHRLGEMGAARELPLHRGDHGGMGMPDQHHPEAVVEVDVLVAVHVPYPAALTPVDEHRLGWLALKGAGDPTGDVLGRGAPHLERTGAMSAERRLFPGDQVPHAGLGRRGRGCRHVASLVASG